MRAAHAFRPGVATHCGGYLYRYSCVVGIGHCGELVQLSLAFLLNGLVIGRALPTGMGRASEHGLRNGRGQKFIFPVLIMGCGRRARVGVPHFAVADGLPRFIWKRGIIALTGRKPCVFGPFAWDYLSYRASFKYIQQRTNK